MQKGTSQVTSGNIAPTISGPRKDKDVLVVSGLIVSLAAVIGAFWYYSSPEQMPLAGQDKLTGSQVSEALKSTGQPLATPVSLPMNKMQDAPAAKPEIIHADVYFEVGRKGLTDHAKAILATQADLAKNDPDLGILVQGYTDQQGSASYNKKLGRMRGEKVKDYLVGLGVSDHAVKVVSLGEEGALCIDTSDVCRNMNRRVHLEIRKIGKNHMILPTVATEPETTNPVQATSDNLLPSLADLSATDPSPLTTDPASGS